MDQKAKELDVKYQRIWEIEKKISLHRDAVKMLKETGLSSEVVAGHIEKHRQTADELKAELDALRKEQLDDFMYADDIEELRILSMRYLENLSWTQMNELTGSSKRWLMKIRDKALSKIASAKEDSESSPEFTCCSLEDSSGRR